jgi:hypothetical protein
MTDKKTVPFAEEEKEKVCCVLSRHLKSILEDGFAINLRIVQDGHVQCSQCSSMIKIIYFEKEKPHFKREISQTMYEPVRREKELNFLLC